ncbi:MAG TPA: DUF4268 domain-containing protein [Aggregatilineales bacterium]|nr:DUF4268 domain-containing protein [Aggregatilineales bacterium]
MVDRNIGKIEVVPVRQAFRHEALDFTAWLEQNIEALSERLGVELTVLEREKKVGDFKVDLLCQDGDGNRVIIENQLEKTDHDHLGKVLTYLVNLDAHSAIWITTDPRSEHERVIDWLNENTSDTTFYLVRVEAIRIGNSPYAPLFTVLAQPDSQLSEIGATKKELSRKELKERHHRRLKFWTSLLEKTRGRTQLHANKSPSTDHWLSTGIGLSGVNLNYLILRDGAAVDLYIDVGDYDRNKALFDALEKDREAIENEFGDKLEWRRMEAKRSSRIVRTFQSGSSYQEDTWDTLQDEMIEAMIRLDKALRPRIARLRNI